jgi:hypothetical protein
MIIQVSQIALSCIHRKVCIWFVGKPFSNSSSTNDTIFSPTKLMPQPQKSYKMFFQNVTRSFGICFTMIGGAFLLYGFDLVQSLCIVRAWRWQAPCSLTSTKYCNRCKDSPVATAIFLTFTTFKAISRIFLVNAIFLAKLAAAAPSPILPIF